MENNFRIAILCILFVMQILPMPQGMEMCPASGSTLTKNSNTYYTSSDYSKDGEVLTLQKSTEGIGIDFVILGEGFVDKDMVEGGHFERRARKAMEQFFAYEPFTSLRNRFNVYAVKVVSPNAEYGVGAKHALNEDYVKCMKYAAKAPLNNLLRQHVMVIYNKTNPFGRNRCKSWYGNSKRSGSFCCFIMDNHKATSINHEAGGHGFGMLLDEYVDDDCDCLYDEDYQTSLLVKTQAYEVGANVGCIGLQGQVSWQRFLDDPRYKDEGLGIFEGAFNCKHGIYRPTENSMMRFSNAPFNAPSRESIYINIMKYSEGSSWQYDYEEFVKCDAVSRTQKSA